MAKRGKCRNAWYQGNVTFKLLLQSSTSVYWTLLEKCIYYNNWWLNDYCCEEGGGGRGESMFWCDKGKTHNIPCKHKRTTSVYQLVLHCNHISRLFNHYMYLITYTQIFKKYVLSVKLTTFTISYNFSSFLNWSPLVIDHFLVEKR